MSLAAHNSHKILVVTNDAAVVAWLRAAELQEVYQVQIVNQGEAVIATAQQDYPELILLEAAIPEMSYLEICRALQAATVRSIIIVLLERGDAGGDIPNHTRDCIAALNAGAHDCLQKFSDTQELQAIMRSYLRRLANHPPHQLQFGDLVLDLLTKEVYRDGYKLYLTAREFQLLAYFMHHPRRVINRTQILEQVWEYKFAPNVVDVYIHYLRNKLEKYNPKRLIHTVHRVGYVLRC
jgi:two-component system response regulator MprA